MLIRTLYLLFQVSAQKGLNRSFIFNSIVPVLCRRTNQSICPRRRVDIGFAIHADTKIQPSLVWLCRQRNVDEATARPREHAALPPADAWPWSDDERSERARCPLIPLRPEEQPKTGGHCMLRCAHGNSRTHKKSSVQTNQQKNAHTLRYARPI